MPPEYFFTNDMMLKLNLDYKILFVSDFGSTLYKTRTEKSDIDLICVVKSDEDIYTIYQSQDYPELFDYYKNVDLHIVSECTFQRLLNEHDIMALEVYYNLLDLNKELFEFTLNLDTLRRKISAVVNNSWSKARKKLDIPEESDYIALKSLFHSLRILSYGINLAQDNKIDYLNVTLDSVEMTCKELWEDILNDYNNGYRWKEFKEKYTPIQNANATKFRLLAPKEL